MKLKDPPDVDLVALDASKQLAHLWDCEGKQVDRVQRTGMDNRTMAIVFSDGTFLWLFCDDRELYYDVPIHDVLEADRRRRLEAFNKLKREFEPRKKKCRVKSEK